MGTSTRTTAIIAALTTTVWPTIAAPQDGDAAGVTGGFQVDFGVSSSLTFDDNFTLEEGASPGSSTIFDTTLDFAVSSVTPVQSIRLAGSGVLRYADLPTRTISGFEDPFLQLAYVREGADSRLTFDASIRSQDRDFLDPFAEDATSEDLINDGGKLETQTARFTYESGMNGPLGFRVSTGHDDRNYIGTTDPDLYDNTTDDLSLTVSARVSPVARLSATAAVEWYTADDSVQTDRTTDDFTIGLDYEVNPSLTATAAVGYTRIRTDELGVITEESGATGSLALDQALTNGNATASFAVTRSENGARSTLTFGRNMDLPSGKLAATAGLTRSENGSVDWIGSVDYTHNLKTDTFNVRLDRRASLNSDEEDVIETGLAFSYGHEINEISRLGVTLDMRRSEDGGVGAAPTIDEASLRATYTRELTQDWNLEGGVRIRYYDDSSVTGSAQSNSIFLTINRDFSFRP